VHEQRSEIFIGRRRHPNHREAIFQQQSEDVLRIAFIGLLLPWGAGANLAGIPY
jgi:hypothetical protein